MSCQDRIVKKIHSMTFVNQTATVEPSQKKALPKGFTHMQTVEFMGELLPLRD